MTDDQLINELPEGVFIQGYFHTNEVFVDGKQLDLKASLKIRNHSPTGFNWGYGGSGPAQFALALLLCYADIETAERYYMDLKFRWVAGLPQDDISVVVNLRQIMKEILDSKQIK